MPKDGLTPNPVWPVVIPKKGGLVVLPDTEAIEDFTTQFPVPVSVLYAAVDFAAAALHEARANARPGDTFNELLPKGSVALIMQLEAHGYIKVED